MRSAWRRFEAWATGLSADPFVFARLRLTVAYTVIIAVILFVFSQIILVLFRSNIHFIAQRYTRNYVEEYFFVSDAVRQLELILLLVNSGLLVFTAGASYLLAGRTLAPIRKILEQQRQFLSDASHELRTPLAVLKTNIEVELEDKKSSLSEHRDNLRSNLSEVDAMTSLVGNLLLLSRLDVQKNTQLRKVVLSAVVGTVVSRLGKYAQDRKVTVFDATKSGRPAVVLGDYEELVSAFSNILRNAIDYNKEGGKVTINLAAGGRWARVQFRDTGRGIPREQLPLVFNRFYRGEPGRAGEGTGLGLAIVKAVVVAHRGRVEIDSGVGRGTTVVVTLPLVMAS